jgi:hypothetical protein
METRYRCSFDHDQRDAFVKVWQTVIVFPQNSKMEYKERAFKEPGNHSSNIGWQNANERYETAPNVWSWVPPQFQQDARGD